MHAFMYCGSAGRQGEKHLFRNKQLRHSPTKARERLNKPQRPEGLLSPGFEQFPTNRKVSRGLQSATNTNRVHQHNLQ